MFDLTRAELELKIETELTWPIALLLITFAHCLLLYVMGADRGIRDGSKYVRCHVLCYTILQNWVMHLLGQQLRITC